MTTSSATTPLKQIICIKWGTKYGADYVNKLYGMVSRNITPPFRFVCFTDNTDGIRPEVECQDLPVIDYPMPVGTTGQWPKSRLWSEKLGNVTGNVLFLDLDVVIVGNIDVFFGRCIIIRNFILIVQPSKLIITIIFMSFWTGGMN